MSELSRQQGSEGYGACDDEVPCGCPAPCRGAVRSILVPGKPETVRGLRGDFAPKSNRGKYCPDCAAKVRRRKEAERQRKRYQLSTHLRVFKPL